MDERGSEIALAPGRSCADCTMCCKVMLVEELAKPAGRWCEHCDVGKGCKIYTSRPESCARFHCVYLLNATLREHWKPSRARMVVTRAPGRVNVIVDPERPDAWRKEPYHSDLRAWSRSFAQQQTTVVVCVGDAMTAILPDRDVALGSPRADKALKLVVRAGANGPLYDVEIVDAVPAPAQKD